MPLTPDRRLIIFPDRRLRDPSAPITKVDGGVRDLGRDLVYAMDALQGRGLAAIQIGVARRMIVVRRIDGRVLQMVNPEIVWSSPELQKRREGCLSIPGVDEMVARPRMVRVNYIDECGTRRELDADGMTSACIQHEVDHLDGALYFDHVSRLKRDILLRKSAKFIEAEAREALKPKPSTVM